jgi:hypothetical protein
MFSQNQVVNEKVQTIQALYDDKEFASSTMREVEEIRRTANNIGFLGSAGLFAANELSRLTLRSRKY